jgi:hypothetical protein
VRCGEHGSLTLDSQLPSEGLLASSISRGGKREGRRCDGGGECVCGRVCGGVGRDGEW